MSNWGALTQEIQRNESREFIERTFQGSLPQFVAAFTNNKALTSEEVAEIKRMIDSYEEG